MHRPDPSRATSSLRRSHSLCALPESKLPPFFAHALVGKSLTLAGSLIGGTSEIAELFDLAAKHGIKAWTETRPMSQTSQVRRTDLVSRFLPWTN